MKTLYVKQKLFSLGEKFTVMDQAEQPCYFVEGSFMKIPKSFTITNTAGHEIAEITKKIFSFLPKFYVNSNGREIAMIEKEFSFFKARYNIYAAGLEVEGNWWDMDFSVSRGGQTIASIKKEWFKIADTYTISILDEQYEELIIALVIAIDCVKADERSSHSSSSSS
jgi:uncharacterized protein YxjI